MHCAGMAPFMPLDHFRMPQMFDEGRCRFDEGVLQLGMFGIRNQHGPNRLDDLLVEGHFVVDVRPVKRFAMQIG